MRIIIPCAVANTNMNSYERNVLPLNLYGEKRYVLLSCKKKDKVLVNNFFREKVKPVNYMDRSITH